VLITEGAHPEGASAAAGVMLDAAGEAAAVDGAGLPSGSCSGCGFSPARNRSRALAMEAAASAAGFTATSAATAAWLVPGARQRLHVQL